MILLITFNAHSFGQTGPPANSTGPDTTLLTTASDSTDVDSLSTDSIQSSILSKDAVESKVNYKARDSIQFDVTGERIFLFGDAIVTYEDIELKAAMIEVQMDSNIVHAQGVTDSTGKTTGNPVFKDGDQEFESRHMSYNFDTKKGIIHDVITEESEGYIHGENVKKEEDDVIYIKNGRYTTCGHDDPHFAIAAKKMKVIPKDKIVTGPANLIVEDVPTPIAVPFGIFPNSNGGKSGIKVPEPGENPERGFYFRNLGYYFYINDRVNFTVLTDIYTKGSWAVATKSEYKKRYRHTGFVDAKVTDFKTGVIREDPNYSSIRTYWLNWNHSQDRRARPNSSFSANVNMGSSQNFVNDINTSNRNYLNNNFASQISYNKSWGGRPYSVAISARHNQNNTTDDFNINLPQASFALQRVFPFKSNSGVAKNRWYEKVGISYDMDFRNDLKTKGKDISMENLDSLTGEFNYGIKHGANVGTNFKIAKYFTLNPSANYTEWWYFETIRKEWDLEERAEVTVKKPGFEAARNVTMGTDLTTKLYGMMQMRRGPIKALRHVLTPSIGFRYRPEFVQGKQFYTDTNGRDIQYSIYERGTFGGPAFDESGRFTFGLRNNIEMKVKKKSDTADATKKVKLMENLNLTSGYDIARDSLKLDVINLTANTNIVKGVGLQVNGTFDPYAFDSVDNTLRRVNRFEYDQNGSLARFTKGNLALNLSFSSAQGKRKKEQVEDEEDEEETFFDPVVDFDIPWNLRVNYTISYDKPFEEEEFRQIVDFSGDLSLTQKWKLRFTSGWDFQANDVAFTSIGIERDLHCWVMSMDWIPAGGRQSYTFNIRVKANILQDLKLEKKEFR